MNNIPVYHTDFPPLHPPQGQQRDSFWDHIIHPNFQHSLIYLICNELRMYKGEVMSNEAIRSSYGKLQGYVEMLSLPEHLAGKQQAEEEPDGDRELERQLQP